MDPKDITNRYTRNEMNDLADTLGVGSPDGYPNKEALAEVILEWWSKKKIDVAEDIDEIKSALKLIRDSKIDINVFKNNFKRLMGEKKEGQLLEMFETLEEVKKQADAIVQIDLLINSAEESLDDISNQDKRKEFEKPLKQILDRCKEGEYVDAMGDCIKLNEDIESSLRENKDLEKELVENLEKAKEKLSDLRETKIEIGHIKELIRDAVDLHKKGDFKASFEKVKESLESSESILDVYEKIEEGKSKIQGLKEKGNEIGSYIEVLKRGKKKADEKDYQYAMQLLDDALLEMERDLKVDIKEAEEKVDDTTLKVKNIYKKIVAIEKALQFIKKDLEDLNK